MSIRPGSDEDANTPKTAAERDHLRLCGRGDRVEGRAARVGARLSPAQAATVEAHLSLVSRVAWNVKRRTPRAEFDDLISDGRLGLIEAAMSFDPTVGAPFPSWAALRIHGAMIDGLRRRVFGGRSAARRGMSVMSLDALHGDGSDLALGETIADPRAGVAEIVEAREDLGEAPAVKDALDALNVPSLALTDAELRAVEGIALGETSAETAARLLVPLETIKSRRRSATRKLGAKNGPHAVYIAARAGLLEVSA
jgi:RNA polymerase sigma factor for flagellar operon FliA